MCRIIWQKIAVPFEANSPLYLYFPFCLLQSCRTPLSRGRSRTRRRWCGGGGSRSWSGSCSSSGAGTAAQVSISLVLLFFCLFLFVFLIVCCLFIVYCLCLCLLIVYCLFLCIRHGRHAEDLRRGAVQGRALQDSPAVDTGLGGVRRRGDAGEVREAPEGGRQILPRPGNYCGTLVSTFCPRKITGWTYCIRVTNSIRIFWLGPGENWP